MWYKSPDVLKPGECPLLYPLEVGGFETFFHAYGDDLGWQSLMTNDCMWLQWINLFLQGFKPPDRFISSNSNRRVSKLSLQNITNIGRKAMAFPGFSPWFSRFSHICLHFRRVTFAQWSSIQYLSHYSDTVGQWYRSVVGKCLNILGTPGNSDYFEAENAGEKNLGHLQGRCIYRMYIYIYDV
jgi:hypothetical protein